MPKNDDDDFDGWLAELDRAAAECGYGESFTWHTGDEPWRDYYDAGLTPLDALTEDANNV